MTTNSELIDQAMSRLGQRSSTRLRADVVTEINTTIDTLERGEFLPWFLEETATMTILPSQSFDTLPGDFGLEMEDSRPYYLKDGKTHYLTKRLFAAIFGEDPPDMRYYAIRGTEFYVRQIPDEEETVYLPYTARQTGDLADDGSVVSNLWLHHAKDWVLGEALAAVASLHLSNDKLAATQAVFGAKGKRSVFVHHEARVNMNQDFEVGGISDGS